jgi:hypothetical protein
MRGLYTEDRPDPREIDWLGYYNAILSDQQPSNNISGTYECLLACYRSGQVSERQWTEHLRDPAFAAWLRERAA